MRKKIIVQIRFNTSDHQANQGKRFTKEWIDYRISIFMKYTLQSLKIQTNQDFITLVRYESTTEDIIREALRHYEELPNNILFIRNNEYKKYIKNSIKEYDWLYLARIDSDDMYHKSFIQQLHDYNHKEDTVVLINQKGYIYDSLHNKMCLTKRTSPPFYVEIYKSIDYMEGKRHPISSHKHPIRLPHEILNGRNYVIVIHSNNTASTFEGIDSNSILQNGEEREILQEFIGMNSL